MLERSRRPSGWLRHVVRIAALVSLLALGGAIPAPGAAAVHRVTERSFASGTTTLVFAKEPQLRFLGRAINVCVSEGVPANCPPGATIYLVGGSGWFADLSAIPQATWIWAPGTTPDTAPAELAQYHFVTPLLIPGRPTGGTLYFAVDDFAEAKVNGEVVASIGSITDVFQAGAAQNQITAVDIGAFLRPGLNIISVRAQNGPPEFTGGGCTSPCTYRDHPAGVVFGGTVTYRGGLSL